MPIPVLISPYFIIPVLIGRDVYRENKLAIQCVYAVVVWGLLAALYAFRYTWDKRNGVIRQQESPDCRIAAPSPLRAVVAHAFPVFALV